MKNILLVAILLLSLSASAQKRPAVPEKKFPRLELLKSLRLTPEQERRIKRIIQRQRLREYLERKELFEILTAEQRKLLLLWKREQKMKDSAVGS